MLTQEATFIATIKGTSLVIKTRPTTIRQGIRQCVLNLKKITRAFKLIFDGELYVTGFYDGNG